MRRCGTLHDRCLTKAIVRGLTPFQTKHAQACFKQPRIDLEHPRTLVGGKDCSPANAFLHSPDGRWASDCLLRNVNTIMLFQAFVAYQLQYDDPPEGKFTPILSTLAFFNVWVTK